MNDCYKFYWCMCVLLILGKCIGDDVVYVTTRERMYMNETYGGRIGTNQKKDKKEYYEISAQSEEKPIQLIYPSEDHSMLLLNATNMKYLAEIDKPVAVVSVVGPLHSGKSFLMNQLLNRTSGFELGPTTMPKTRGLWMWKRPIKIEKRRDQKEITKNELHSHPSTDNSNKKEYYLLLLDSEGLYASQANEIYDAKIFAISTLLSSYLIYNSVKFVDQASIDALRLLVKRSHLFELRMELKEKVEEGEERTYLGWLRESERHLKMPKLLWVIQDFVQIMEEGQSPKEWLNSMMEINREEDDDDDAKKPFDQVFREIDCYTLFLPQYEKHKLVRLDLIESSELLEEYRNDVEKLRKKVFEEAPTKEDEEGECDGAKLSRWLQRLVLAANKGMFPKVPSMWMSFQRLQKKKAIEDAAQYFEHELRKEVVGKNGERVKRVMNRREMKEVIDRLKNEARTILERMVYGLIEEEEKECTVNTNKALSLDQDSYQSYNLSTDKIESNMTLAQKFDFKINLLIDTYMRLNEQYIAQYCEECYRKNINHVIEKVEALDLPINLRVLGIKRSEWYEEEVSHYRKLVNVYLEEEEKQEKRVCSEYGIELEKRIELEWKSVWEDNLQKLGVKLKKELEILENKQRRILERQIMNKIEEQEKGEFKKNHIVFDEKADSILPSKNKGGNIVEKKNTLSHQLVLPFKSWPQLHTSPSEESKILVLSQPPKKFLKYSSYQVISPSTLSTLFSKSNQDAQAYWTHDIIHRYDLDYSPDFKAQWDSKLSHVLNQLFHEFKVRQDELLSLVLDEQTLYFIQWLSNLLDQYVSLPQPKHQLYVHVTSLYDQLIQYYDETFSHLAHLDSVMARKSKLYLTFKDELTEIERRNERKLDFILSITLPTFKDEIEQTVLSYWIPQDAIHFAKTQMIKKLKEREHIVDEQIAHELANRFIQKYLEKSIEYIRNRLILLVGFIVTSFTFIIVGIKLNRF